MQCLGFEALTSNTYALLVFKHSVIKRRGEEDITLWVDHEFIEATGPKIDPAMTKRAVEQVDGDMHKTTWHQDTCVYKGMHGDTGPNAPCTGGLKEIESWVSIAPSKNSFTLL
jgi:hypothetical protein